MFGKKTKAARKKKKSPATAPPKQPRPPAKLENSGWFTLQQLAAAFDISTQALHESVRPHIAPDQIRGAGERGVLIHCRGAIDGWVAHKIHQAIGEDEGGEIGMAAADGSPNLERWRKARATIAEMELAQLQGQLVPLDQLEPRLGALCGLLRRAGESLARQFGNEAADLINVAVDEFAAGIEASLHDSPGSSDPPPPPTPGRSAGHGAEHAATEAGNSR